MFIDFVPNPDLYPFTSRWFDSSAGRMHYIDEGSGPALLFCHGTPTWSFLYRRIVVALRDRYRCIALDHLGFGLSERPEGFGYGIEQLATALGEFIDALELDDFVVMGHAWVARSAWARPSVAQIACEEWCSATPPSGRTTASTSELSAPS